MASSPQPSILNPSHNEDNSTTNQATTTNNNPIQTSDQNRHKDPQPNPPSVEAAYKRKCINLKQRLSEIETENENIRLRNRRSLQYVQKMRLESCILLERLALVTGMVDEIKKTGSADGASGSGNKKGLGLSGLSGSELKAKVVGIMNSGASAATGSSKVGANGAGGGGTKRGYIDNDTDGSSEERPPTPQERPLRVKRSRKPLSHDADLSNDGKGKNNNNRNADRDQTDNATAEAANGGGNLPVIAPAPGPSSSSSPTTTKSRNAAPFSSARDEDRDRDIDMQDPRTEDDNDHDQDDDEALSEADGDDDEEDL